MRSRIVLALALATSFVIAATPSPAAAASTAGAITKALDYIHACQKSDGGFAEKGSASSEQMTAWAIVAIAAAGEDPGSWRVGRVTPLGYLARFPTRWQATTDYARTVLAVVAGGGDPRHFAGVDLVAKIRADRHSDGANGDRFGPYVNSHAWALIALKAAGEPISDSELRWLVSAQNADGGWGWAPSIASDSNDTAAALQALVAAGQSPGSDPVRRGLDFMKSRQAADGGFSYSGSASDANSTAWGIQALAAAGQSPQGSRWRVSGGDPLSRLRSLQDPDGSLRYFTAQRANPLFVTLQAIPALAGKPFPVARPVPGRSAASAAPRLRAVWPKPNTTASWRSGSVIRFEVADGPGGTGVSVGDIRVRLDGKLRKVRVSKGVARFAPGALGAGSHTISVRATDRAGNAAVISRWKFSVGASEAQPTVWAGTATSGAEVATATSTGVGGAAGTTTAGAFGAGASSAVATAAGVAGAAAPGGSAAALQDRPGDATVTPASSADDTRVAVDVGSSGRDSVGSAPAGRVAPTTIVIIVAGLLSVAILVAGAIAWRRV